MKNIDQKPKKIVKQLRFYPFISTILIPTRQEFFASNVGNLIWSSEEENKLYKIGALEELKLFRDLNNLRHLKPNEVMRRYCESIGSDGERSDSSGNTTSCSTPSEDSIESKFKLI